jgi:DnaJ-class molecular chaperone
MFTSPSLQIIKDCVDVALAEGGINDDDREAAQDIADFCASNIKAVCPDCGGTGLDPDTGTDPPCEECKGSGVGPQFQALIPEMGEKNTKIMDRVQKKFKERKDGKS